MSSYYGKVLPPISDDKMFEKFIAALWEKRNSGSTATLFGRSGQAQHGIDVLITTATKKRIAVQCKAVTRLTEKMLIDEVAKATNYRPPVDHFVLVTTAPHDANLVTAAQRLSMEHGEKDLFPVTIFGWGEILRLAEPHPEVVHQFFPEFLANIEPASPTLNLELDQDLSIPMSDVELALYCSETATALKANPRATVRVLHPNEQQIVRDISEINELASPNTEQRTRRAELQALRDMIGPRLRQLEAAIPILLTDDEARSPWLIGPVWSTTASVLRSLVRHCVRPHLTSVPGHLALKMRSPYTPEIVTWIDLDEHQQAVFMARNSEYSRSYFLGGVFDLGDELGPACGLPAGIAALVRYSANFATPLDDMRRRGDFSIYQWSLEAA